MPFHNYVKVGTYPQTKASTRPKDVYLIRSFYFFKAIVFLLGRYLQNSCLFQSYINSAICFELNQPTKTFTKPKDLPVLRY